MLFDKFRSLFVATKLQVEKLISNYTIHSKTNIHLYDVFLGWPQAIENLLCNIIMVFLFNQIERVFVAIHYFLVVLDIVCAHQMLKCIGKMPI